MSGTSCGLLPWGLIAEAFSGSTATPPSFKAPLSAATVMFSRTCIALSLSCLKERQSHVARCSIDIEGLVHVQVVLGKAKIRDCAGSTEETLEEMAPQGTAERRPATHSDGNLFLHALCHAMDKQ